LESILLGFGLRLIFCSLNLFELLLKALEVFLVEEEVLIVPE
jgi:hypothetical protein